MASSSFEITERNESGHITARYVTTTPSSSPASSRSSPNPTSRVTIHRPRETKPLVQKLVDVFLPAGYPQSVTGDYMQYQIYDSLQAFSSSIAGLLASRAVLEGIGVGSTHTSPTAALLLSILQESMGRIATILFAHRLGTALEPECKMYRLLADIFNDTAMVLDCLSPAFPKPIRVAVLGGSSVLRSLCGVCAGSAKASLSAHFARKGNLGEVNAKDSSQETVISLFGMLAGSVVVSWVTTPSATWSVLIALLSVHIATNYAAVKAVSMRSLNRQRANIVLSSVLEKGIVLGPIDVSKRERIFERDGVLRWADDRIVGYCRVGVTLEALLNSMSSRHKRTEPLDLSAGKVSDVLHVFADEAYILWFAASDSKALVVLKEGCTPMDQLQAWAHALLLARRIIDRAPRENPGENDVSSFEAELAELRQTLEESRGAFQIYGGLLKDMGWDLGVAALETRAGTRAVLDIKKKR